MPYVREIIKPADQEKIFADADEIKRSHLRMRGGYFTEGIDAAWAIDRERDLYLLRAPTIEARSPYAYFYFHFHSCMYGFRIRTFSREPIQLNELPPDSSLPQFQKELLDAFEVYQSADREPLFTPLFETVKE